MVGYNPNRGADGRFAPGRGNIAPSAAPTLPCHGKPAATNVADRTAAAVKRWETMREFGEPDPRPDGAPRTAYVLVASRASEVYPSDPQFDVVDPDRQMARMWQVEGKEGSTLYVLQAPDETFEVVNETSQAGWDPEWESSDAESLGSGLTDAETSWVVANWVGVTPPRDAADAQMLLAALQEQRRTVSEHSPWNVPAGFLPADDVEPPF